MDVMISKEVIRDENHSRLGLVIYACMVNELDSYS